MEEEKVKKYLENFDKAKELWDDTQRQEEDISKEEEIKEIDSIRGEIISFLDRDDTDNSEEENDRMRGVLLFLTPILNLKTNSEVVVEFDKEGKRKQLFLLKKGFYELSDYSTRKSLVGIRSFITYFSNESFKKKLLSVVKEEKDKEKLLKIFNYFSELSGNREKREKRYRSYEENPAFKQEVNILMDYYVGMMKEKDRIKIYEFRIDSNGNLIINFNFLDEDGEIKKDDYGEAIEDSYRIRGEELTHDNLTLLLPIRKDLLLFLKKAKEELEKKTKTYFIAKAEFYSIIKPFLLANTL